MKGTRVQSIIRELRGEKIDIVEWSDDPATFVVNALSPAKVSRVSIVDEEQRIMEVVVEDKQLSLAIGKKGQNVRLAAKIVGWRIDIKSEEEKRREVEAEMARMARAVDEVRSLERHGVGEKTVHNARRGRHPRPRPPPRDVRRRALRHRGRGPEDGREDPRGRGPGEAGVGRADDAAEEAERLAAEQAAQAEQEAAQAEQARAGRAGGRPGGGRRGRGRGRGGRERRGRGRARRGRRKERRGGWDGWGTLGSSVSPET